MRASMSDPIADQTIDAVEQELVEATQFVPEKKYRKRQDYLAALMRAVCDLPDPEFDKLSDEAVDWSYRSVDAHRAGQELPDFEVQPDEKDHEPLRRGPEIDPEPDEESDEDPGQDDNNEPVHIKPDPEPDADVAARSVSTSDDEDHESSDEEEVEGPKRKRGRPKGSKAKVKVAKPPKEPKAPKVIKIKEKAPKVPKVREITASEIGPQLPKPTVRRPRQTGVNKWGVLRGSKSDTVCQMLAQENGATMEEIKEVTGHYHYNLCNRLKRHGFKIMRDGMRIKLFDSLEAYEESSQ